MSAVLACPTRPRSTVEQLVTDNIQLAYKMAGMYVRRGSEPFEDLLQVASLGLVLAAQRFDPSRGVTFGTYAFQVMSGEIKRHYRDKCWPVHVPRTDREREVTDVERAWIASAARPASFNTPIGTDAESGAVVTLGDKLGAEDTGYDLVESRLERQAILRQMSPVERQVLYLYYVEDLPQKAIGKRLGYSQMHISRIFRRARAKLGFRG